MWDPALPRADSPWEKLRRGPFGPLENTGQWSHCPASPAAATPAVFETSSRLRQKQQTVPQKPAFPAPLLANSGKHHMTSLSLRLSLAHSLTTYWQKFLLTRSHQIFSLLCLLSSKFKICFHYSIKDVNSNSIQMKRAFKWINLWLWMYLYVSEDI